MSGSRSDTAGIVIVGAGECGTRAAFALRHAGYDGPVTLLGEEAGLPYERPPLSKVDGGHAPRCVCDLEKLTSAEIAYLPAARAMAVDAGRKTVALQGGSSLRFDRLLLATGARPRALACPGGERAHVFRTFENAKAVHGAAGAGSRVAIVGAGLIGMELAATLSSRGAEVTVIEAAQRPLGRAVPAALAWRLHRRHVEAGVSFVVGAAVDRIDEDTVYLQDGRSVPADVVVVAIGVIPNTSLAEASGLATGNGILVDACLRTSAPDIFAAGDCACLDLGLERPIRYETWRNAQTQGELAGRNMVGRSDAFRRQPWFWSDQYELGLQVVGLPSDEHVRVSRRLSDEAEIEFFLDRRGTLTAAAGLGPGNAVAKEIRIAEMLIDAGTSPSARTLSDPTTNLKVLLKQARAA